MPTANLIDAKNAKNDEFYTQYHDIEKEIAAYLEYNADVFRGKTVLCPCDDPEWSNFTKFFALHFQNFGLRKLISTSFAADSNKFNVNYQPTLFETQSPQYDAAKTRSHGKIFVLERGKNDEKVDINNLQWRYLEGDGDFRSGEIKPLRDEADFIVTNPPFSLFREFMAWLFEKDKKFVIIGNMNAISYKEIFPLIKNNKIWLGVHNAADMVFGVPTGAKVAEKDKEKAAKLGYVGDYTRLGNSCWFTNVEHGRRHQPLSLMPMADVLKFSKHKDIRGKKEFDHYDNYDAIEVSYTDAIPCDYRGVMGVPISFLDKYCPEQFEILGITKTWFDYARKSYPEQIQVDSNGKRSIVTKLNDGATIKLTEPPTGTTYYMVDDNYYIQLYARILIKHKDL